MYRNLIRFPFVYFGTSFILYAREEKSTETSYNKTFVAVKCCRIVVRCKNSKKLDCEPEKKYYDHLRIMRFFSCVSDLLHNIFIDSDAKKEFV